MSEMKDVLEELRDQFRQKRAESVKVVKLRDFGVDTDEEWHFYPWTQDETDKVAPLLAENTPYRAVRELIFLRTRTPKGERRFRTDRERNLLREIDGGLLRAIVDQIEGFDDMLPDVEEARKNSGSTRTSETE